MIELCDDLEDRDDQTIPTVLKGATFENTKAVHCTKDEFDRIRKSVRAVKSFLYTCSKNISKNPALLSMPVLPPFVDEEKKVQDKEDELNAHLDDYQTALFAYEKAISAYDDDLDRIRHAVKRIHGFTKKDTTLFAPEKKNALRAIADEKKSITQYIAHDIVKSQ
jgi:hypothetical protein